MPQEQENNSFLLALQSLSVLMTVAAEAQNAALRVQRIMRQAAMEGRDITDSELEEARQQRLAAQENLARAIEDQEI
jgi:hypothetical protein